MSWLTCLKLYHKTTSCRRDRARQQQQQQQVVPVAVLAALRLVPAGAGLGRPGDSAAAEMAAALCSTSRYSSRHHRRQQQPQLLQPQWRSWVLCWSCRGRRPWWQWLLQLQQQLWQLQGTDR